RRFADAAGDGDDLRMRAGAGVAAEVFEASKRIVGDFEKRTGGLHIAARARYQGERGTGFQCGGHEVMAIAGLALDRHENIAGLNVAAVDGDAADGREWLPKQL